MPIGKKGNLVRIVIEEDSRYTGGFQMFTTYADEQDGGVNAPEAAKRMYVSDGMQFDELLGALISAIRDEQPGYGRELPLVVQRLLMASGR